MKDAAPLTEAQLDRELARQEAIVSKNLRAGRDMTVALVRIMEMELWRRRRPPKGEPGYSSFKNYVSRRWPSLDVAHMLRKTKGEVARAQLCLLGVDASDLSGRALNVVAGLSPEEAAAALELARALADETPTAEDLADALEEMGDGTPAEEVERTRAEEQREQEDLLREKAARSEARFLRWLGQVLKGEKFLKTLNDEQGRELRIFVKRILAQASRLHSVVAPAEEEAA